MEYIDSILKRVNGSRRACPSCGASNPPDNAFCEICGGNMNESPKQDLAPPRTCPHCSCENPAGNEYCMECGMSLSKRKEAPSPEPANPLVCWQCSAKNVEGVTYCTECGARLMSWIKKEDFTARVSCPNCRAENPETATYCASCGASLFAPPPPNDGPAPVLLPDEPSDIGKKPIISDSLSPEKEGEQTQRQKNRYLHTPEL